MTEPPLFGHGLDGNPVSRGDGSVLGRSFVVPPFSILNAQSGHWQSRKKRWIELGIESELGRQHDESRSAHTPSLTNGLTYGMTQHPYESQHYPKAARDRRAKANRPKLSADNRTGRLGPSSTGTSIFDPVLCELMCRWFCPKNGMVLDPFAGGSVRGIVAAVMGLNYWGCDLSGLQITSNRKQAERICPDRQPVWRAGDSTEMLDRFPTDRADMILTCPPYGNLETYTDDPRDLSNMPWDKFLWSLGSIMAKAGGKLRRNRFAVVVVGDYRGADGFQMGFPAEMTKIMTERADVRLYNEIHLMTMIGTLAIRTRKQFDNSRKVGRTHQTVLVFVKGCPLKATRAITG